MAHAKPPSVASKRPFQAPIELGITRLGERIIARLYCEAFFVAPHAVDFARRWPS